jgi:hypothetical protein
MKQTVKKVKSRRALLISVIQEGNGFRVILDDVVKSISIDRAWIQKEHVTSKLIQEDKFQLRQTDEKELADFAYYVLARLKAYVDLREN